MGLARLHKAQMLGGNTGIQCQVQLADSVEFPPETQISPADSFFSSVPPHDAWILPQR